MPTEVVFETYVPDPRLIKYKKELAARHHLQSLKDQEEPELEGRTRKIQTPEQKVRRILC